jgi:4'-phosphopantetheinyl transferase
MKVDVWIHDIDLSDPAIHSQTNTLSPTEKNYAQRLRFDRDRARYIAAHRFLRHILSQYLPKSPEQIDFGQTENGKPFIKDEGRLMFNLSHADELVAVVVSQNGEVGIDIERVRSIDGMDAIVGSNFSSQERTIFASTPRDLQTRVFLTLWTRKEAYVKALGGGLSTPLDSFDTSDALAEVWLSAIKVPEDYVGTVAVAGGPAEIIYK